MRVEHRLIGAVLTWCVTYWVLTLAALVLHFSLELAFVIALVASLSVMLVCRLLSA